MAVEPLGAEGRDAGEPTLSHDEVRRRAASGVVLVALRTLAVRGLGLAGTLVLARLLLPADFGVLALGQTLILFGTFFVNGGVATGLLRRPAQPTRDELRTVLGCQLLLALTMVGAVAAVALPLGRNGQVTTLMVASLLLGAFQTPPSLVLQRRLDYTSVAAVEVLQGLVFVVWSVTAVALGAGVWGVATANLAGVASSAVLMVARSPVRTLRPGLRLATVRELLGFGLVVQAGLLVNQGRLQAINLTTAAVAGLPVLGLYSLADRVIQLPWLLFESILRVTFPAMARLLSSGADVRQDLERALRLVALSGGALLCLVAATSPVLVTAVFGQRWQPAAAALPPIAVGILVGGPVVAVGTAYLFAIGDGRRVLTGTVVHTAAWFAVAVPLLPSRGVQAVGLGLLAGFCAESAVLARGVRSHLGVRCYRTTAQVVAAVLFAGCLGYALASSLPRTLASTALVAVTTSALLALALFVTARAQLREALATVRSLRSRR